MKVNNDVMIERFLDEKKRIKIWPAKRDMKLEVLYYLAEKFKEDVQYSEKEVNAIISQWHTFNDFFLLRRGMIDMKLLSRTRDGLTYWKSTN